VDPHHPALDDGELGIPYLRDFSWGALGVLRFGLGRLLGMGSGGERVADALAHWNRIPALSHDAGEAQHAEDVEHVAGVCHLPALDLRDFSHA